MKILDRIARRLGYGRLDEHSKNIEFHRDNYAALRKRMERTEARLDEFLPRLAQLSIRPEWAHHWTFEVKLGIAAEPLLDCMDDRHQRQKIHLFTIRLKELVDRQLETIMRMPHFFDRSHSWPD